MHNEFTASSSASDSQRISTKMTKQKVKVPENKIFLFSLLDHHPKAESDDKLKRTAFAI